MRKHKNHITVFEHEVLRIDKGDKKLTPLQFEGLKLYHGEGVPYYRLVYNGIQFNEHVGVIQVGDTVIEVLPKADSSDTDEAKWREILIDMLRAIGTFQVSATSSTKLKIKPNSILDLYFKLFVEEVEYLLHTGLIKKYRKNEGNVPALKGSLVFNKHIQVNLVHCERFYVRHSVYDIHHLIHCILYKAINLLKQINTNLDLNSRIGSLLLNFPEMSDIKVAETVFNRIVYNRKTNGYKKAIEIAKLLLLNYHPDVSTGRNHVLALMFDMNNLWEQFVYVSLRKHKIAGSVITPQSEKHFWKPEKGMRQKMKPDIWVKLNGTNYVLDTKWKNLNGRNPSPEDLRQLFVYNEYYDAKRVALVYPGNTSIRKGNYLDAKTQSITDKECSVICLDVNRNVKQWQEEIAKKFQNWMNNS